MKNPFDGWLEHEQCYSTLARDAQERPTYVTSPQAAQWCAFGRLLAWSGDDHAKWRRVMQFRDWVEEVAGFSIEELNDRHNWTPEDFRQVWHTFSLSRG